MKKIFILINVLLIGFFVNGQNPVPSDSTFPVKQALGNAPTTLVQTNAIQAKKGFINGVFADTTTANLYSSSTGGYRLKYYPGAQIFTTSDSALWLRNSTATRWMRSSSGSGSITSFNFITDSTLIICYGDGTCDTIPIYNLTEVVTNITQNFLDSNVTFLNDSTIIICNSAGSCDTIALGTSNTYYFLNDSTLVTCDTAQSICVPGVLVTDSCYQHQLCDTITITKPRGLLFQNGLWNNNGIVEHGNPSDNWTLSQLVHDTYLYTDFNGYYINGRPGFKPPVSIENSGWAQSGPTVIAFNHKGGSWLQYPGKIDNFNTVDLRLNYITQINTPIIGTYAGDTIGPMLNRIGYSLMTNSGPYYLRYQIDNSTAKQVGIMFHTLDTAYTDAVTIFGQQVPSEYGLNDSTLLSKRIAVFHTDQSSNFLGEVYLTNGRFEPDTAQITAANDLTLGNGNVFLVSGNTQINAITTSGWQAGSSPIHLVFSGTPTVKNNTAGSAGTATILLAGRTDFTAAAGDVLSLLFDGANWYETNRSLVSTTGGGYFNPNQTSTANTTHDANFKDFRVNNLKSFTQIAGVSPYTNAGTIYFDSTLVEFSVTGLSGVKLSSIDLTRDSIAIKPQGGAINIDSLRVGASTDSVMTWDAITGEVRYRNASSFGISGITADNGLTASTATNVQLGANASGANSPLLHDTYINTDAFSLRINTGTGGVNPLKVDATTGFAIWANSTSGYAVYGESANTNGIVGRGDAAFAAGIYGQSQDGWAGFFMVNPTSTNTIVPIMSAQRQVQGTATDGVGGSFDFNLQDASGSANISNKLISKWTTVANATRTSQLIFTGVDSSLTDNLLAMGDRITLTESSATQFATTTIPDGRTGGGEIIVTVSANDAIDFQARTLRFIWVAENKGGTTTVTISTPEEVVAVSGGTLTVTITAVDGGSGVVQFKANAVSSLSQNILRCSYQISKNF